MCFLVLWPLAHLFSYSNTKKCKYYKELVKKTGQLASNERFLINMKKCKYGYTPDGDSTIDGQIEIPIKANDDDLRGPRCANTFDDSSIPGYSANDFTNAANETQQAIAGSRDKQEVEHVPYETFKGLKTETERVVNFSYDALLVDRIYSDLFKMLHANPESYDIMRELVISLETIFDKYLLSPVNDRHSSSLKNYIITCEKLCGSKVEETACESKVEETESRYNPDIGSFLTAGISKARTMNDIERDLNSVYGLNCGLLNDSDINVFSTAGLACDSSSPLDSKLKESKKILEFIKECLRQHLTFDEAKELLRMTDVI